MYLFILIYNVSCKASISPHIDMPVRRSKLTEKHDLKLAEHVRAAIGAFVRKTRQGSGTVSDARSETLGYLDRSDHALNTAELARLRGVTHQSMRLLLVELLVEGLIEGSPDPKDRRATLFRLSPKGTELLRAQRSSRAEWLADRWICKLSAGERETISAAITLMDRVSGTDS
jgi:DNA-binding MarR family transcriptional regulator